MSLSELRRLVIGNHKKMFLARRWWWVFFAQGCARLLGVGAFRICFVGGDFAAMNRGRLRGVVGFAWGLWRM